MKVKNFGGKPLSEYSSEIKKDDRYINKMRHYSTLSNKEKNDLFEKAGRLSLKRMRNIMYPKLLERVINYFKKDSCNYCSQKARRDINDVPVCDDHFRGEFFKAMLKQTM